MGASDDRVVTLVVLFAGNPGSLTQTRTWARPLALAAVGLLVVGALWATVLLVFHLVTGAEVTESPGMLLAAASLVYIGTTSRSRCCTGCSIAGDRSRAHAETTSTATTRSRST